MPLLYLERLFLSMGTSCYSPGLLLRGRLELQPRGDVADGAAIADEPDRGIDPRHAHRDQRLVHGIAQQFGQLLPRVESFSHAPRSNLPRLKSATRCQLRQSSQRQSVPTHAEQSRRDTIDTFPDIHYSEEQTRPLLSVENI